MSDENELDIKKVIEKGTQRTTLKDLAQQGFENVKVLDQNAVEVMITKAVDRVVSTQTAGERTRILAESRKELDRLLKEQRASRSRTQLLESDKNELVEQVEGLQRELQLKSELEEENLHRQLEQGLASLQSQVEELRTRYQAEAERARSLDAQMNDLKSTRDGALAQLEALQKDVDRLTADRDRVEKEAEGALAKVSATERELTEERSRARGAEKARTDLVAQILDLQSKAAAAGGELQGLRPEVIRQRSEIARLEQERERQGAETTGLRQEAEGLRAGAARLEKSLADGQRALEQAQREAVDLRSRLGEVEREAARLEKALGEQEKKTEAAGRAEGELRTTSGQELARLQADLEAARQETAFLHGQIAQQQKDHEAQREKTVFVTAELQEIEERQRTERQELERLRAEKAALEREAEAGRAEAARLEAALGELTRKAEATGRAEAELRTRLAGTETLRTTSEKELEAARQDLARLQADLEAARQESAFLRGQIAQQQKDTDTQREKTVIVTAELQEIEEKQRTEQQELEGLRADSSRVGEENERLRKDLETGRGEIEALQDLLRREQEAARTAQNESVSIQARHQDLLSRSAETDRELERLRSEGAARASADRLEGEVGRLASLLESARRNSSAARASATRSREVTSELERTLARQLRPKGRKRGTPIRGGAAYDGMALLEGFFRKIRLKEHFQKYLPVREQPGRPHPSELMVEVLKAIVAGNGRGAGDRKAAPLEIVGPSNAPDAAALRQFLGGLSTQAVQSLARVHHGLRLHLSPLPKKPQPLVLDVAPLELGLGKKRGNRRTYAPLVCFDPAAGEFWNGHFRSSRVPAADGILPFLQACLGRVPAPFARGRIRFRMDSRFFNEAVIRFLDSKGVAYVIQAPDTAAVRKAARRCAFNRLSNGWEVGEFLQRLHPIRRTQGRFMVLRRRMSKTARAAGPGLFHDERHFYHVFATDRKGTPWRSFEVYAARPASLERARGLLSEFTTSRLLGRSRRSVAALFQAHLLASDLMQAFRRSCLPAEEKEHGPAELRNDFLLAPSQAARSLVVLPRRDRRRRLFARVARLTRRLKPARPFRLRS